MFTNEQKKKALRTYKECGSVPKTIKRLGYPSYRTLYVWIEENESGGVDKIAKADEERKAANPEELVRMGNLALAEIKKLNELIEGARLQMDLAEELLMIKDTNPEVDISDLSTPDRALIVERLREKYPIHVLLEKMELSRNQYYYLRRIQGLDGDGAELPEEAE